MAQVIIPNRPAGSDTRSIEALLADFDAITAQVNGNIDYTNIANSLGTSATVNTLSQTVKGYVKNAANYNIPGTSYTQATTPDQVSNLVLTADGYIEIVARCHVVKTVGTGIVYVGLFLGTNQVVSTYGNANAGNQPNCEAQCFSGINPTIEGIVATIGGTPEVAITPGGGPAGLSVPPGSTPGLAMVADSGSGGPNEQYAATGQVIGCPIVIAAAAGTYNLSMQYKADAGVTASVNDRLLYARAVAFA